MLSFSPSVHTKASLFLSDRRSKPIHPKRVAMLTRTASEILPRLWLSGWYTAVDEEQLLKLGVTHILSIIDAKPRYPRGKFKTMHVQLQDIENADILRHLDATTAFIRNALEDERNVVLVHCAMGISRSATAVCAYLVAEQGFHPRDALDFVASKREIVCPNPGFRHQLDVFYTRLRSTRKLYKAWRPASPLVLSPARPRTPVLPLASSAVAAHRSARSHSMSTASSPRRQFLPASLEHENWPHPRVLPVPLPPPSARTRRGSLG